MKANELMVGNIVRYDGMTVYIGQVNKTRIEGMIDKNDLLIDIRFNVQLLEPIPITEELLLKNGFDEPFYRTDTKCSTHVRSLENGCGLWVRFHVPRKYWYLDVVNEDGFILSSGKVDYLHQLQNLCNIAGVEMKWKV